MYSESIILKTKNMNVHSNNKSYSKNQGFLQKDHHPHHNPQIYPQQGRKSALKTKICIHKYKHKERYSAFFLIGRQEKYGRKRK